MGGGDWRNTNLADREIQMCSDGEINAEMRDRLLRPFGRRVSFLAEGVKRDSEEAHLLKTVPSGGAWRSEDEGEETLLTSL